jgi:hypothetical protein
MARKTVLVSDQSGEVVEDGKGAVLRITYTDARRGSYAADLTESEAQAIVSKTGAKSVARRGSGDAQLAGRSARGREATLAFLGATAPITKERGKNVL